MKIMALSLVMDCIVLQLRIKLQEVLKQGPYALAFGFETTTTEIDHCLIALEKILTKGGN